MAAEREQPVLTGIHIDLVDYVVTLETRDGRKAKLSFTPGRPGMSPLGDTPEELTSDSEEQDPGPALESGEHHEKQRTVVLTGRLRTKPKEGRPDGKGVPTAWSRLAVHEDGENNQAHMYSATFHRHTAAIALGLDRGAQVTVEGYAHGGNPAEKRLDTLSVIAVHRYPGKPEPATRRGS